MKRVLMLVPSMGMGGMERVCVNYANLFNSRGYKVTLLNLTFDADMIIKNLSPDISYHSQVASKMPNAKNAGIKKLAKGQFRIKSFNKWLMQTDPQKQYRTLITDDPDLYDIEIAFYGGDMMRILCGSLQKNSIKIGWIHSPTIERHFPLFESKEDAVRTYRSMDVLVCVSQEIRQRAKELFGEDVNAQVINNPNNTKLIRSKAQEPVTDIQKRKFTFINASRIDMYHKGFDRLIEAAKRLKDEGLDFEVWVLGNGKDEAEFKACIDKFDVGDRVLPLGSKPNPYNYMGLADCYICSSRHEGFSMVVAEAIILGLPVVTTDISGTNEMFGDSEYGLITENSTDGIYAGMKQVLTDKAYFEHLQGQAKKRMDYLSEERIMDQMEACFDDTFKKQQTADA